MRVLLPIGVAAVAASLLATPNTDADDKPAAPAVEAALSERDREEAEMLIASACSTCHAQELIEQQRLTRKQWEASVKKMQTWGAPLETDRIALVARMLSEKYHPALPVYQPHAIDAKSAARSLAPTPDGPLSRGNRNAGATAYQSYCASCHGDRGIGSGLGPRLLDHPILFRAQDFMSITTKGRGRMPALPEISTQQVAAILAYLRNVEPGPLP